MPFTISGRTSDNKVTFRRDTAVEAVQKAVEIDKSRRTRCLHHRPRTRSNLSARRISPSLEELVDARGPQGESAPPIGSGAVLVAKIATGEVWIAA
jgi:hypothetical protein